MTYLSKVQPNKEIKVRSSVWQSQPKIDSRHQGYILARGVILLHMDILGALHGFENNIFKSVEPDYFLT